MPEQNNFVERALHELQAGRVPQEEQGPLIARLCEMAPRRVADYLALERREMREHISELTASNKELYEISKAATALPHPLAKVVSLESPEPGHVFVQTHNGDISLVQCAPEVAPETLRPFDNVLLTENRNCVLGTCAGNFSMGEVAEVAEVLDGLVILRTHEGAATETARVVDGLAEAGVETGDRVLYDRAYHAAYEKLPKRQHRHSSVLEPVHSLVTFDDIGGNDDIKEEIAFDINVHCRHGEAVEAHDMRPSKSMLFVGPPGNAKTMLALGTAHLIQTMTAEGEVAVYRFPPGRHRSVWYGQTEKNLDEIFDFARSLLAQGVSRVVILFDEIDNLGQRSNEMGNSVDSRILPVLLERIQGLNSTDNILFVGTSNRADDLLDEALMRPGRFGDKVYRLGAPDRQTARCILEKYLKPHLPYRENGTMRDGAKASAELVNSVLARIYGPDNSVGTVVSRSERIEVPASKVVSGAILENITRKAKQMSLRQGVYGGRFGISRGHLLHAAEEELAEAARRLRNPQYARRLLNLGHDFDITNVILASEENVFQREGQLALRAS